MSKTPPKVQEFIRTDLQKLDSVFYRKTMESLIQANHLNEFFMKTINNINSLSNQCHHFMEVFKKVIG